jgi:L-iditol 2-dehydrogenase
MKTLRLYGVHDLRFTDELVPEVRLGNELVRVTSVGICGSDSHWFSEGGIGGIPLTTPLVLGHEFTGIVETGVLKGQRVAVDPAMPCGKCEWCLEGKPNLCPDIQFAGTGIVDGALQEYVVWPTKNLFQLPPSVSNEEGALLEPLGVALHAHTLATIRPGMTVGVFGCGSIGLLAVQLARLSGAGGIFATDIRPTRLEEAQNMGASGIYLADGSEARKILFETHHRGVDIAFEAAGDNSAVEAAITSVKPGGRVVIIGIPTEDKTTFTASTARRKGLTILICRRMKNTYPRAINLVAHGKIDLASLISSRFPFDRSNEAFLLAEKRVGIKVMINLST